MEKMTAVNVYMPEMMKLRIDALIGRKSRNEFIRDAVSIKLAIEEAKLGKK